jgi:hypothetical protein
MRELHSVHIHIARRKWDHINGTVLNPGHIVHFRDGLFDEVEI